MIQVILVFFVIFIVNGLFWKVPILDPYKHLAIYSFLLPILFEKKNRFNWIDREIKKEFLGRSLLVGVVGSFIALLAFYLYLSVFYDIELQFGAKGRFFVGTIMFAITEELLFRGYFFEKIKELTNRYSTELNGFYTVFGSSLLFAVMHVFEGVPKALLVFIPGLFFGLLKWKTNHMAGSCVAHIFFNVFYLSFDGLPF